jgi:23S rRNA (pseudouridine1915-N3)-methyltransferase
VACERFIKEQIVGVTQFRSCFRWRRVILGDVCDMERGHIMHIRILAVGKTKEKYIELGIKEYAKRLQPYARLEIVTVGEEKLKDNLSTREEEQIRAREGEQLLKGIKPDEYVIVLDVKGKTLSSEGLAQQLFNLALYGNSTIVFIIGGALGLAPEVINRADLTLSLSPLTFTHQMVRLILVEQLYRAFKIMRGEPYHR